MKITFRNLGQSKEFYLCTTGGLIVALFTVSLELLKDIWANAPVTSKNIDWIVFGIVALLILYCISRWSYLMNIQDDIDVAILKKSKRKK